MRKPLLGALSLACFAMGHVLALEAAAENVENIAIVLDCSRSMAEPMAADGSSENRLDAARGAVLHLLEGLATTGQHRITLCLFGHRLAAETNGNQTTMHENRAYFDGTNTHDQLITLMPGDDVEIARNGEVLEQRKLQAIQGTLDLLQPWGEEPLYLSLRKMVDIQPADGDSMNRRIIVITDGGNTQAMGTQRATIRDVLSSLEDHPVPIHIVKLGGNAGLDRQTADELNQLARQSGGKIYRPTTIDQIAESLQIAVSKRHAITTAPAPGAPFQTVSQEIRTPQATEGQLLSGTVTGVVSYYQEKVKGASVILRSVDGDLEGRTDAAGRFFFKGVPLGTYVLEVRANVHNRAKLEARVAVVDARPDTPPLEFIIKFQEPAVQPPPPVAVAAP